MKSILNSPLKILKKKGHGLYKYVNEILFRNDTRLAELIIFAHCFWWMLCLNFLQSKEAYTLWLWYWKIDRFASEDLWDHASVILVVIPFLQFFLTTTQIRKIWLLMNVGWWSYVGIVYFLARYANPNSVTPLVVAGISLVTYLDLSVQTGQNIKRKLT